MMLPTIDYLKENATDIYYFGLGFIQVKVGDDIRYNFYHKKLTPCFVEGEDVHSHPYDFESTILKGNLLEILYEANITYKGKWDFCEIDCKGSNRKLLPCNKTSIESNFYCEGVNYKRCHETLHSVTAINPTITKVVKGTRHNKAFSLMPRGQEECTPFISTKSPQECWDIVEEVLKC